MLVKAIARYNNIIPGRIATDEDLKALDGIFVSEPFEVDSSLCLTDVLDYAYDIIEPILPKAYCDSLELVEI